MKIKSISLNNFKNFEGKHTFDFEKMTLIAGENGAGKSTILEGLVFIIWGYTAHGAISDIPTRTKAKSCSAGAVLSYLGHEIEVIRHFPLKIIVKVDGKALNLSTAEANDYLITTFGTREFFMNFILLDAGNPESNLLEKGPTTLKKIIFAGTDTRFNLTREKLSIIKQERERLNGSSVILYKHYPSEKRLNTLTTNLVDIGNSLVIADDDIKASDSAIKRCEISLSENKQRIKYLADQIGNIGNIRSSLDSKLRNAESRVDTLRLAIKNCEQTCEKLQKQELAVKETNKCYTCNRLLETQTADEIIKARDKERTEEVNKINNFDAEIIEKQDEIKIIQENIVKEREQKAEEYKKESVDLKKSSVDYEEEIINYKSVSEQEKTNRVALVIQKEKITNLKMKLEGRLKQKEFIYTEQDVIVAKKAIEEIDKLSSYYLCESVKTLEPIINSVLDKINFKVSFDVDLKGKFNILLEKEGIQYKNADLSTGEKLILQIAFKLAILMRENKADLLVCDEGLGSLDANNLEHILEIIRSVNTQLIMVLHRYEPTDNEIKVIKLTK